MPTQYLERPINEPDYAGVTRYKSLRAFAKENPDDVERITAMCLKDAADNIDQQFRENVLFGAPIRLDVARREAQDQIRAFAAMHGWQIDD